MKLATLNNPLSKDLFLEELRVVHYSYGKRQLNKLLVHRPPTLPWKHRQPQPRDPCQHEPRHSESRRHMPSSTILRLLTGSRAPRGGPCLLGSWETVRGRSRVADFCLHSWHWGVSNDSRCPVHSIVSGLSGGTIPDIELACASAAIRAVNPPDPEIPMLAKRIAGTRGRLCAQRGLACAWQPRD